MRLRRLLPFVVLLAGACRSSTAPGDPPLSGVWVELCGVDVACVLDLRLHGTTIDGRQGGIVNSQAPHYDSEVSGTFAAPRVHLEWSIAGRFPVIFDGTLEGDTALVGVLSGFPDNRPATYHRSR